MELSPEVMKMLQQAVELARDARFEYVTPELILYVACQNPAFAKAFKNCDGNIRKLDYQLRTWLEENMETKEEGSEDPYAKADAQTAAEEGDYEETGFPTFSYGTELMLSYAWESAQNSEKSLVELPHLIHALYALPESYAAYYMQVQGVDHAALLREMTILWEEIDGIRNRKNRHTGKKSSYSRSSGSPALHDSGRESLPGKGMHDSGDRNALTGEEEEDSGTGDSFWQQYAVCLNEQLEQAKPLIGRQEELERTMQILCRLEKNNPLHLGEPGVGKTAVTFGLARLLEENRVPEPLRGAKIFSLDLGSLLAGTQYRGDFEKRFKKVMDSLCGQEKPIVYIDEIHNIVGAVTPFTGPAPRIVWI